MPADSDRGSTARQPHPPRRAGVTASAHRALIGAALAVLVLSAAGYAVFASGFLDLRVYRASGYAVLHGIGLYSAEFPGLVITPLPFTYPPFAALVCVPLSLVSLPVAQALITAGSVLGTAVAALVVARRCYGPTGAAAVVGVGVAAVWLAFEPVRSTVGFGQINLILLGMVVADCLLPRVRWPRGLLVGIAAAVKLTPAVFVLLLLLRRQYRAAAVSVGAFAGCCLVAFAVRPADSVTYWTQTLLDASRIGRSTFAYNQNLQGLLHRVMAEGTARTVLWVLLAAAAMLLAVLAARRAVRAGAETTALLAVAAGGLLASPVSWSHHWVWIIPAAVLLVRCWPAAGWAARGATVLVVLVFAVAPHAVLHRVTPFTADWPAWQQVLGSGYVLVAAGFLIMTLFGRGMVSGERAVVDVGTARPRLGMRRGESS